MCKLKHPQMKKFTEYDKRILFDMMKDLKLRDKIWLWRNRKFFYSIYKIVYTKGFNRANKIIYLINNNKLHFSKNVEFKKYH